MQVNEVQISIRTYAPEKAISLMYLTFTYNKAVYSQLDNAKCGIPLQGAKVDHDNWPYEYDPKWIGSLLSSSTTFIWSLEVIGQKL